MIRTFPSVDTRPFPPVDWRRPPLRSRRGPDCVAGLLHVATGRFAAGPDSFARVTELDLGKPRVLGAGIGKALVFALAPEGVDVATCARAQRAPLVELCLLVAAGEAHLPRLVRARRFIRH